MHYGNFFECGFGKQRNHYVRLWVFITINVPLFKKLWDLIKIGGQERAESLHLGNLHRLALGGKSKLSRYASGTQH